ncbi:MAG: hypothetical protein DDT32_00504 [Syntrophomonadaceae bacterium]|nr:hypothetical protein [Bacillota bacterium]
MRWVTFFIQKSLRPDTGGAKREGRKKMKNWEKISEIKTAVQDAPPGYGRKAELRHRHIRKRMVTHSCGLCTVFCL